MNEVSLLFYGQPEQLSSALLLNLNIIEFREKTDGRSGLYILENKFGKEVVRRLSLDFNSEDSDWLVYRYLSDDDLSKIRAVEAERKVYVLLQNFMTVDYFKTYVPADNSSYQYLVGQNELIKSMTSVAGQFGDKNVFIVKNVKKSIKLDSSKVSRKVPDFMAALLKLILNPVDEFNMVSKNLMHSNQRVLYRLIELLNFIHFVLYRGIGLQLFWKSLATIGYFRVASIKTKFFLRHLVLMEFYKVWGFAVDSANFFVRAKDKFILTVYYRTLHRSAHVAWISIINPLYFKILRPVVIGLYSWVEKWIYYRGIHRFVFLCLKFSGYIWQNFLSPFYFATIHRFFYSVLVRFFYYGIIHRTVHSVIKPSLSFIFYGVIQRFYYRVVQVVYYSVFHRGYHQILKPVLTFIFYRGFHLTYHRGIKPMSSFVWYNLIVSRIYYGLILRLYYNLKVSLLYRLWPWVKFNLFIRLQHFFIFKIRHYVLMGTFKSYGLGYDLVMLLIRVTKLYLLYPFFKIYWFTSFQYNKRIKKYFV